MKSKKIVVVGSTNMDMVVKTDHIPVPGETVLSGSFFMNPGGKGANQAVTIARLGGDVSFVGKVGNDIFGKQAEQLFDEEGINIFYLLSDDELPSGVALITVDEAGENSIVVASGSNANLLPADIKEALPTIEEADYLLMQLEIPMETVLFVAEYAHAHHTKVIVNPAPMNKLTPELLQQIDILTPNETEAGKLAGMKVCDMKSAKEAAQLICKMGVKNVVITMGSSGAIIYREGQTIVHVPSKKVEALDTTAAGDVFNGALTVALSEGKDLKEAARFACEVAAISVTRMGAQSSIPYRNEVFAGNGISG